MPTTFHLMTFTVKVIRFFIKITANDLKVSFAIEDKERSLLKRRLKSDVDAYDGPLLVLNHGQSKIYQEYFVTLSQRINLEIDSGINCLNYPSKEFHSYRDCDEDYVYNQMKHTYKIMPFWAAKTLDEVTSLMLGSFITQTQKSKFLFVGLTMGQQSQWILITYLTAQ